MRDYWLRRNYSMDTKGKNNRGSLLYSDRELRDLKMNARIRRGCVVGIIVCVIVIILAIKMHWGY